MPGKEHRSEKEHGSSKSSALGKPIKHESQRVKTEKVAEVEDRRSKKHSREEATTSSRTKGTEGKPSRQAVELVDSKKVSFVEETKRGSKKTSKDGQSRRSEMPLSEFDDEYTSPPKKSEAKKPVTPEDNYSYEDDFEQEYQDDFEDDNGDFEEEEKKEVKPKPVETKAVPKPTSPPDPVPIVSKRAPMPLPLDDYEYEKKDRKPKSNNVDTSSYQTPPKPQPSIGLNFKAAVQRTSKLSRRANDLLRLVTFDVTRVDFFDFPVVSEYDLYILSYGKANRKQTAAQTFDDAVSREAQTDKIDVVSKWTQNPPDNEDEYSGGEISRLGDVSSKTNNTVDKSEHLAEFVKDAGSAMLTLLNDLVNQQNTVSLRKTGGTGGKKRMETKFGAIFGSRAASFSHAAIFQDDDSYVLERVLFPPDCSLYLISIHGPKEGEVSYAKPHKIAVWSTVLIQSGTKPVPKVIVSTGVRVTCAAMESGLSPELLFVGHVDGSLAVWDFRAALGGNAATFRSAASVATSSAVFTSNDTHLTPMKCLLPLPLSTGSSLTDSQAGLRCELLSLDESGLLATWAVADLGASSNRTMSDDPAVTPGGRIRLLRSSYGNIQPSMSLINGLIEPTCMRSHPTSPSRILVGLSSGDTLHVARYGSHGSGGLGSGNPNIFARKYVSPVLTLAHFLNSANDQSSVASSGHEIIGAFISGTALGFSVYVTSRSQPVLTFDADPARLLLVFAIPTMCALTVLGSTNSQDLLATVATLTSESKIQLYQIGPKSFNHWSGAATEITTPTPTAGAPSARAGQNSVVFSIQTCADSSAMDADDSGDTYRYISAVAFSSGAIDLFISEPISNRTDSAANRAKESPAGDDLIGYLLNLANVEC